MSNSVIAKTEVAMSVNQPSGLHRLRRFFAPLVKSVVLGVPLSLLLSAYSHAADGKKVTLTGEMIDTWCYVSQIMGSSAAVTGTAHHVCAVWCAAGGIPVGLLNKEDNKVYICLLYTSDAADE